MLHPTVLSHYEAQVAALQTAMTQELRRGDSEPARILRELIETVTVKAEPSAPSGLRIEIAGRLRALLGERAFPNGSVVCETLVAEDRYRRSAHTISSLDLWNPGFRLTATGLAAAPSVPCIRTTSGIMVATTPRTEPS
jgi:hypothetical protein